MLREVVNKEPINKIIKDITSSRSSTVLLGNIGSGKSTVLNNMVSNKDNLIIDGSVKDGEFLKFYRNDLFDLYHMTLLIQKMILDVCKRYPALFNEFILLKDNVDYILNNINEIYITDTFFEEDTKIDSLILEHPEILLECFLNILYGHLDIPPLTVFLDRFDNSSYSNRFYQKFMYNTLNKYLKVVISVSDLRIVNNTKEIKRLQQSNQIIKINYNKDVAIVKDILDRMVINSKLIAKQDVFTKRVSVLLDDDLIELLITRTNGNLFLMGYIIRDLYRHLKELTPLEYENFILNYPLVNMHNFSKRRLYL